MMNKGWIIAGAAFLAGMGFLYLVGEEAAKMCEEMMEPCTLEQENETIMTFTPVGSKHDIPNLTGLEAPFSSMSADWGEGDIDGWRRYNIPEEYKANGGYFPEIVQVYLYCLCRKHDLDYPMVIAMIEVESGYRYDAQSEDGGLGYLQVVYEWHKDRMAGLHEDALLNPYINIRIAVDYLSELKDRFIADDEVLTAYNYGVTGAKENFWDKGVYQSPYSDRVLAIRNRIHEELKRRSQEAERDDQEVRLDE